MSVYQFEGESELACATRSVVGLRRATDYAREVFMADAITGAESVEDLKPILLRLLYGD